jgi:threonine synthase
MKYVRGLRCRECGRDYPIAAQHVCEFCFGPLEVVYDYEEMATGVSRASIEAGPHTMWRYEALLPAPEASRVDLGTGFTTLRQAPRLAAELGLRRLWLKSDAGNPTNSFKDRVVGVALSVAREMGFNVVACASTGNLANAVAAHAAAAGMQSVVFIPNDLEPAKVTGTAVYGGLLLAVDGSYDDVNRLCAELSGSRKWAFVNVNVRPYYAEGSKTIAFEVVEQLGWRTPDAFVVPVASGSLLTKIGKGLRELNRVGLLEEKPNAAIHGAQAEGCSPVATAFAEGADEVQPVKPQTVAKSLAIGNPADGHYALEEVRSSGGTIESVPEPEVAEGMRLLARTEGLFTETAGGVTISALERMVRSGGITSDQEVVALITGIGLKTMDALGQIGATHQIRPSVEEVDAVIGGDI